MQPDSQRMPRPKSTSLVWNTRTCSERRAVPLSAQPRYASGKLGCPRARIAWVQRLLQCIKHEIRSHRTSHVPAHDMPRATVERCLRDDWYVRAVNVEVSPSEGLFSTLAAVRASSTSREPPCPACARNGLQFRVIAVTCLTQGAVFARIDR